MLCHGYLKDGLCGPLIALLALSSISNCAILHMNKSFSDYNPNDQCMRPDMPLRMNVHLAISFRHSATFRDTPIDLYQRPDQITFQHDSPIDGIDVLPGDHAW